MSIESNLHEHLRARLGEAVDFALLSGLLKFNAQGSLHHAPFSLAPCPLEAKFFTRMEALSAPLNRLMHKVAQERNFVEETLAPAARVDPFTARLLEMAKAAGNTQSAVLAVTRSDYFIHCPGPEAIPQVKQVEMNTISASYPGLAALTCKLHAFLLQDTGLQSRLLANDPLTGITEAFHKAFALYGYPDAVVLEVVHSGESNVFDQRLFEYALRRRGIATRRMTLEEIAERSVLREGHLVADGEIVAITYFRAAYGPEDFNSEEAFQARERIESSSTLSVPGLFMQLAGTKKIQQVLTDPTVLRRFLSGSDAAEVEQAFAGLFELEQVVSTGRGEVAAWEWALEDPSRFVLKPQREGGGHNFFDDALVERLHGMGREERSAYVLMERIVPPPHPTVLVSDGQGREAEAVSEIGTFGAFLAEGSEEAINCNAGYLVRTKHRETREGGVSAGFGFLDSLLLDSPRSGF